MAENTIDHAIEKRLAEIPGWSLKDVDKRDAIPASANWVVVLANGEGLTCTATGATLGTAIDRACRVVLDERGTR